MNFSNFRWLAGGLILGVVAMWLGQKSAPETVRSSEMVRESERSLASTGPLSDQTRRALALPSQANQATLSQTASEKRAQQALRERFKDKLVELSLNDPITPPPPEVQKEFERLQAAESLQALRGRLHGEEYVLCESVGPCVSKKEASGLCVTQRNHCRFQNAVTPLSEMELANAIGVQDAERYRMKMEMLMRRGSSRD
ncbi:MAG: hypothetical protein RJB38_2245 [Pseudomonadota bacterium]